MSKLMLATEGGQVVQFDSVTRKYEVVFRCSAEEAMMGIEIVGNNLFVASLSRIYKLSLPSFEKICETEFYEPTPDFHQMQFYDGLLYVTATKNNQIWMYDENLELQRTHQVIPPRPRWKAKYKRNYNHINNIIEHEGRFYINLNWLTKVQFASSGVLVTDLDMNEIERFEFGWETHEFQFLDGRKVAICATSSKGKRIKHPRHSGLMVDGELVFEHDVEEAFCKGLCYDEDRIYVCGGRKVERKMRKLSSSIIYILNRHDYSLIEKYENTEIKAIKGAIHFPDQ
ncbi:hypothetical protein N9I65_01715 [bacterium]|nr:hypothetical protein [bacterium]